MRASSLRRALFQNLFLNLALVLGLFQLLVWHWGYVVVLGRAAPDPLVVLAFAAGLVGFNALVFPLLRRRRRSPGLPGALARVYMNLGVVTLLLGVLLALLWLLYLVPSGLLGAFGSADLAAGGFRVASVALVGSVALLLAWGFTGGQARIDHTHHRFEVPDLAPALDGLRIAQISDLHIGNALDGARLARMVERVNAQAADLVVITGDIFDFDPAVVEEGVRALAELRAPRGVYAILGNHDVYTGREHVAESFARHAPGLRLLRDEIVRVPGPAPLYLAGSEDPGRDWAARGVELPSLERLAAERPADGPTLLLVHRPEAFAQAARLGFPLVLAGHTHGGQLALPGTGGRVNLARVVTNLTRGVYRSGASTLYVNRGLGVGGPALRVQCAREIALIELATPGSVHALEHVDHAVATEAHLLVGAQGGAVGG